MCQRKYNQVPPPQRGANKIHFTLKKKGVVQNMLLLVFHKVLNLLEIIFYLVTSPQVNYSFPF